MEKQFIINKLSVLQGNIKKIENVIHIRLICVGGDLLTYPTDEIFIEMKNLYLKKLIDEQLFLENKLKEILNNDVFVEDKKQTNDKPIKTTGYTTEELINLKEQNPEEFEKLKRHVQNVRKEKYEN